MSAPPKQRPSVVKEFIEDMSRGPLSECQYLVERVAYWSRIIEKLEDDLHDAELDAWAEAMGDDI